METLALLESLINSFRFDSSSELTFRRCCESDASNDHLVQKMCRVINRAYDRGEQRMWNEGRTRTNKEEVSQGLEQEKFILAFEDGTEPTLIGCVRVCPLFDATNRIGEWGMLAVAEDCLGRGVGARLVAETESLLRAHGCRTSSLEILKPRTWIHEDKVKLHQWYTRLGYWEVSSVELVQMYPQFAGLLATECMLHVYHKPLTPVQ